MDAGTASSDGVEAPKELAEDGAPTLAAPSIDVPQSDTQLKAGQAHDRQGGPADEHSPSFWPPRLQDRLQVGHTVRLLLRNAKLFACCGCRAAASAFAPHLAFRLHFKALLCGTSTRTAPPAVQVSHALSFPREGITSVHCAGPTLLAGSSAGILRALDAASWEALHTMQLPRHSAVSALTALTLDGGEARIALAASYNKVHAYSLAYGTSLGAVEAHADLIVALSCGGGGGSTERLLFTASHDTTVKAWPVGREGGPWSGGAPPLFELDAPAGSAPCCMQARHCRARSADAARLGTAGQ